MNPEEQLDLEIMLCKHQELRQAAYELITIMVNADDFSIYGYSSLEHAVRGIVKDTHKEMEKLSKAHTKKYPN